MIRRALPMLRRGRFLTGAYDEEIGVKDVTWLTPGRRGDDAENWEDPHARCLGVLLDGRAQETGIRRVGDDSTLLIVLNAHTDVVPFTLPAAAGRQPLDLLLDRHQPAGAATRRRSRVRPAPTRCRAASLLLFVLQPDAHAAARDGGRAIVPAGGAGGRGGGAEGGAVRVRLTLQPQG